MNQVEITKFPSGGGWAIVELRYTPAEVSEQLGIAFEDDLDDLGTFKCAALWSPNVGQIYLEGRPHPIYDGVIVEVDISQGRSEAISALTQETGWDARDFAWITSWDSAPLLNPKAQMRPWPSPSRTEEITELSHREQQVAEAISEGKPTRDIASELRIAPSTVAGHLQRIYLKLGVHSRAELKEALRRFPNLSKSA